MQAIDQPSVSVVVVNWNGLRFLRKLIPLLQTQTYPTDKIEIIVVDNNSTKDDSVSFIKENYPAITLIENSRNDGFAKGCNLGMKASHGEYVVLLNNDTKPHAEWLAELVSCAESRQAGAVVSKLLFANKPGTINNAGSSLKPESTWPVEEIGANQTDGPAFNKVYEITALCGASVLLSRNMLKSIGLFDETFFMYFEDGDLSWRGQKAGWKFYYCPTSVVMHEHSGSSKEHSDFWTFYVTRNRLLILLKHSAFRLFLKAYFGFIRDFFLKPAVLLLKNRERRHQLRNLKLGVKIAFSVCYRSFAMLLRRWRLLPEVRLSS